MLSQRRIDGASGVNTMGVLRQNWLYLETCTTDCQAVNAAYLTNIHSTPSPLRLQTNAGMSTSTKQGFLGRHKFWLDPTGVANVISLCELEKHYHIIDNSKMNGGAFVCKGGANGKDIVFARCPMTGFPYINLDEHFENDAVMLLQTIQGNYKGYTRRKVEMAREARKLQGMIGHPSEAEFNKMAKNKEKHV